MHMYRMQPNWAMPIHRRCRVLTKTLQKVLIKKPNSNKQKTKQNKQQNLDTIDRLIRGQGCKTMVRSAESD